MTKNDYIEKITQNLEHLTKDELKDVATLTNAQFGVRLKVAEKEYWEKEVEAIKSQPKPQLQQQALPVVPEFVAEFVSGDETELSKADRIAYLLKSVEGDNYYLEEYLTNAGIISQEQGEHLYAWATNQTHETILELWNGYTVEKPQLFYLKNTLTHEYLYRKYKTSLGEQSYCKGTDGKPLDYCLFTLDEIESMNTGSYEQIEVTE